MKIYVAGHRGMVGSAVVREFERHNAGPLILRTTAVLDLCNQTATARFFQAEKPDVVIFAAAGVGGIHANSTYPAEFIQQNLSMAVNAVHSAWQAGVPRFLYPGSTCIYPRMADQPISEESLLTGELETTNEAYAIAKIAGVKLCQFYREQYGVTYHSAMPTNLYGPGDNYHPNNSHVLPAFIRRFHDAMISGAGSATIWGSGSLLREFLHVDDLASAVHHLIGLPDPPDIVNVGSGQEISILGLAELVADVVGFGGRIDTAPEKPDGTPRKLSDISRLKTTGWAPWVPLREGVEAAYQAFLNEIEAGELRSV